MKTTVKAMVFGVLAMVLLGSATMAASYNATVTGMKVYISSAGRAYWDSEDDTVTVQPYLDGCTIRVNTTTQGTSIWGTYCDLFIYADDVIVKSLSVTGTKNKTSFWVTGQTYDCRSFTSSYAHIGGTDYYGDDYGLGMESATIAYWGYPTSITLKYGVCWGTMLSDVFDFGFKGKAKAVDVDTALPAAGRQMLFGR
jgi:hypothetical protein